MLGSCVRMSIRALHVLEGAFLNPCCLYFRWWKTYSDNLLSWHPFSGSDSLSISSGSGGSRGTSRTPSPFGLSSGSSASLSALNLSQGNLGSLSQVGNPSHLGSRVQQLTSISNYQQQATNYQQQTANYSGASALGGGDSYIGSMGGVAGASPDLAPREMFSRKVFVGGLPPDIDQGKF